MTDQRPAYQDSSRSSSVREVGVGPAGPVHIEMRLEPSGGQLLISGPGIPDVSVQRIEPARERDRRERAEAAAIARGKPTAYERHRAARFRSWVSRPDLFSRKAKATGMTVAGASAELEPGGGRLQRSSFDVRARVNERGYLLSQTGRRTARVLRDGVLTATLRRSSAYGQGPRYDGDLEWGPAADHLDVAMTHALASAYRVGADAFLVNLLKWIGYAVFAAVTAALGG